MENEAWGRGDESWGLFFFLTVGKIQDLKLSRRNHSSNFQALGGNIKHLHFQGEKKRLREKKDTHNICLR